MQNRNVCFQNCEFSPKSDVIWMPLKSWAWLDPHRRWWPKDCRFQSRMSLFCLHIELQSTWAKDLRLARIWPGMRNCLTFKTLNQGTLWCLSEMLERYLFFVLWIQQITSPDKNISWKLWQKIRLIEKFYYRNFPTIKTFKIERGATVLDRMIK